MLFLLVSSFSYTPDATFNEEFFLVRSFSSLPVLVLVSFFFLFIFFFFFFFFFFFHILLVLGLVRNLSDLFMLILVRRLLYIPLASFTDEFCTPDATFSEEFLLHS